jgi:hypothetical protein
MEDKMNIVLTHHALKRLKKRFGIKSKPTALRYAETIVRGGKFFELENGSVRYLYMGHSYIFTHTTNTVDEPVLLMLTACNDDKCSEWDVYAHGKKMKRSVPKQSTLQRLIA